MIIYSHTGQMDERYERITLMLAILSDMRMACVKKCQISQLSYRPTGMRSTTVLRLLRIYLQKCRPGSVENRTVARASEPQIIRVAFTENPHWDSQVYPGCKPRCSTHCLFKNFLENLKLGPNIINLISE